MTLEAHVPSLEWSATLKFDHAKEVDKPHDFGFDKYLMTTTDAALELFILGLPIISPIIVCHYLHDHGCPLPPHI